ncbi:MAG: non-ribosomal peptide synthetase, partial [Alteromonadaceae bacterium]
MSITATENKNTSAKAKNIESIYPLSPMQAGLLFHTLMNPNTGVYLLQYRHVMTMEKLDIEAFKKAWQQVVARHEVLRTSFVWKKQKQALQVVHKHIDLPIDILDWRHLDEASQTRQLEDLLAQERVQGFDFTQAPLMTVRLIRLDDTRYQFVRSYHHILMDAWCFSLIMMDFLSFYRGNISGDVAGDKYNPPKPAPYKRYIAWLQKQVQDTALDFWRQKLSGFDTPTAIVPSHRKQETSDSATEVEDCVVVLSQADTHRGQQLARKNNITLNTLVQAAWAILLSRYANDEEILFGVTVAGRPISMPEMATVVGLFINSIPLRWRVPPQAPLNEWLQSLFAENLSLREYEYAALPDIQRCAVDMDAEVSLFDSLFVFENAPFDAGLKAENLEFLISDATNRTHTNYPLTIVVIPGEQLHLQITYHCELFEKSYVEQMLQHFENILINMFDALQSQANSPIDSLEMLTQKEQQFLRYQKNKTYQRSEQDDYIRRFEAQALKHRDKVAAIELMDQTSLSEKRLSYGELNHVVNRLAHALLAKGLKQDDRVALMGQRGIDLLTMMLAVLKCGAAYLPLDPKHPPQRLAEILTLSACPFVLSQEHLLNQVSEACTDIHTVLAYQGLLDSSENSTTAIENPNIQAHPRQLAYLIYTSGSTGNPKGVMVEGEGMLNNMLGKIPSLGLGEGDVVAQTASQCFDISVWQFLASAMVGATVVILPDSIAHDPKALSAAIDDQGITLAEQVPSLMRDMLDSPASLETLRWMLPTGEALPPELARQWIERYPQVPLMNAYGPAECSDDVAFYAIDTPLAADVVHTPIGFPTLNMQLYVLDKHLQLVPPGGIGELYVAGVGVGRGYFNRPGQSAEAFLPNPFAQEDGERLYKTGDLARINAAGALEYVGRLDGQVKLRGFRIELGEIEARLNEHAQIQKAVVILREDRPGDQRLVAYYELTPEQHSADINAEILSDYLAAKLPVYMLPAAFVGLEKLPLSGNGKINRRALPAPDYRAANDAEFVAPSNALEQEVAEIWRTVLNIEALSTADNFFRRGGHSLLVTQAVARMSAAFNLDLQLRSVFECPTVAQMAQHIAQLQNSEGSQPAQSIPRLAQTSPIQSSIQSSDQPALALSYAQQRLWFLYRLEGPSAAYNMPVAIRLRGGLNKPALNKAIQSILDRHDALRTCFKEVNGEAQQVILPVINFSVEEVNLAEQGDELALLKDHSMQCFDLGNAPLLSAKLVHKSEREHVLSVVLHHIVADGWSIQILVEEFTRAYAAFCVGQPLEVAELPIQYADYAHWQRQYLQGEVLQKQLHYWREKLGDDHGILSLPSDRPRPVRQSYRGARLDFNIDADLTRKVRAAAQRQGCTDFVILLGAYQTLLARYSGQDDIRVGVPVANRQRLETQGLIGFFINTQVLRGQFPSGITTEALLNQLQGSALEAQDMQDLPFEYLVNELKPERDLSHSPLFQSMFNLLQGQATDALTLPDLSVEPIPILPDTAMFDLNLDLHEEGDVIRGSLEYSSDLFDASTAQRLMDSYRILLAGMLDKPQQPIAQLPLLPKAEYERIVYDWNQHRSQEDFSDVWLQRFEHRVQQQGDDIAAVCAGQSFTFTELNIRANTLAWQLLAQQQRSHLSDQVVAVLSERDLNLLVQIIAVFKTGAAYLPLDPK